jgi:flagellar assembly protein FliH
LSRIIDGQQSAYERWELPVVEGRGAVNSLRPMTADKLEEIHKQAYQEGFDLGHKEGLDAAQKEIAAQMQRLNQILRALAEPLQAADQQVEQELIALAMAVARQIIRRELQTDPEQVVAVVREAMAELPSSARNIRIYLHPDDAALVHDAFNTEEAETAPWKIVEEMALTRGGCRIESDTSMVEASLEKRLNSILTELMGGSRATDEDA